MRGISQNGPIANCQNTTDLQTTSSQPNVCIPCTVFLVYGHNNGKPIQISLGWNVKCTVLQCLCCFILREREREREMKYIQMLHSHHRLNCPHRHTCTEAHLNRYRQESEGERERERERERVSIFANPHANSLSVNSCFTTYNSRRLILLNSKLGHVLITHLTVCPCEIPAQLVRLLTVDKHLLRTKAGPESGTSVLCVVQYGQLPSHIHSVDLFDHILGVDV